MNDDAVIYIFPIIATLGIFGNALPRAAGQGIEPRYQDPKSCVLPLDDPALSKLFCFAEPTMSASPLLPTADRRPRINLPQRFFL